MKSHTATDAFQHVPKELLEMSARLCRLASGSDQPYRLPMEVVALLTGHNREHASRFLLTHIANRIGQFAHLLTDVSQISEEQLDGLIFSTDEEAGAYRHLRDVLTDGLSADADGSGDPEEGGESM